MTSLLALLEVQGATPSYSLILKIISYFQKFSEDISILKYLMWLANILNIRLTCKGQKMFNGEHFFQFLDEMSKSCKSNKNILIFIYDKVIE